MGSGTFRSMNEIQSHRLPWWFKITYTTFLAILIPVYWRSYGPTNFSYFCDVSLALTLISVWTEWALPVSMAAVGIVLPQLFWCVDFLFRACGVHLTGMTDYMFDPRHPLYLRALSMFHGWLPFVLLFMVGRLGYDRRALVRWTLLAWALCLVAYFFLPPAGAVLSNPDLPRNVDYVFGMNDAEPQHWLPQPVYLLVWMLALPALLYFPAHRMLGRFFGRR